jgi:hypothetical protein
MVSLSTSSPYLFCGLDIKSNRDMLLCMRTTIDMPDTLFRRAKEACAKRHMTFRDLVTVAVENELLGKKKPFVLRDASVGYEVGSSAPVSAAAVNEAIDSLCEERHDP